MAEKKKGLEVNKPISAAIGKHYEDARTKKPLAWTLMSPDPLIEIAYAAGIQPVFPENYAAACASRHVSSKYCETAEAHDYLSDICSYCRNCFGYIFSQDPEPPQGGLGEPDMFFMATNACVQYFKWWDTLRLMYNKPVVQINTPRIMEEEAEDYYLDYTMREVEKAIAQIEKITGIKISEKKLAEAVKLSDEGIGYWIEILEMQKTVPAPATFIDLNNMLFPLIALSGTKEGVELLKEAHAEVKQCVAEKTSAIEGEKHRLLFLNIPLWYNLRLLGYFAEHGATFPLGDYTQHVWGTARLDASAPIRSLATKALAPNNALNGGVDKQINNMLKDIADYHIDGVVVHSNRSCKVMSVGQLDAARIINETYDIPVLILDADHTDERVYSDAMVKTRIDAFLETLQ